MTLRDNPNGQTWSVEVNCEQLNAWLRPVLGAQVVPAIVQVAVERLLREFAGKRIRLSAEALF